MNEVEKSLDFKLWQACTGSTVQMPPVNSKVYYFPQGHAEHTLIDVDFGVLPRVPALILCRVSSVKLLAHPETDEVYAKMKLVRIGNDDSGYDDLEVLEKNDSAERLPSFAKILTQSDSNNGGGFSVPRYCGETIFPPLDYSADKPLQTLVMKDVHGQIWKFKHVLRGAPKRHLFTTGWSVFVNRKKLIAGDSIVFMKKENGDLYIGTRRYKRGGIGGTASLSRWNSIAGNSGFLKEDDKSLSGGMRGKGRDSADSFVEAVSLAANGKPFEVVYYPRASTREFCVKASLVTDAMKIPWRPGMRFKMAFETGDSSRISWSMGTIAAVQAADPVRWPDSSWQCLQVRWDGPDMLQNVKCVSPWQVSLVSNMPVIQISQFSPPKKKPKLSQHPQFPLEGQFPISSVEVNNNPFGPNGPPMCCLSDNISAGIQGARHPLFELPFSDLHLTNNLQFGGSQTSFQCLDPCLDISAKNLEKTDETKRPYIVIFGQQMHAEQQIAEGCSSDAFSEVVQTSNSDGNPVGTENYALDWRSISSAGTLWNQSFHTGEHGLGTGHCQAFLESDSVGKILDLSVLRSYEELYQMLADMFELERSEMLSHVLYRDAMGLISETGKEPFGTFMKTAKRLTIMLDSSS
uniref:Auxin response factor n=1 Tax=Eucommia ulmoides TaxID=4392 RepID=A0A649UIL5_EUCUL|nr:ARF10.1 [Eucommia ulmoides]